VSHATRQYNSVTVECLAGKQLQKDNDKNRVPALTLRGRERLREREGDGPQSPWPVSGLQSVSIALQSRERLSDAARATHLSEVLPHCCAHRRVVGRDYPGSYCAHRRFCVVFHSFSMVVHAETTQWNNTNQGQSDHHLSAKLVPTFTDIGVSSGQRGGSLRAYSLFSRPEPLIFLLSSSSVVLARLSGPRSRPTTSQKI
jgi:hypothetical protein